MDVKEKERRKLRLAMGESLWEEYQRKRKQLKVLKHDRRKKVKQKLIDYKGGKCERCGYNKEYTNAYDFHHINPNEKEFGISYKGRNRAIAVLKREVDKCLLLCANCHREVHEEECRSNLGTQIDIRTKEIEEMKNKALAPTMPFETGRGNTD